MKYIIIFILIGSFYLDCLAQVERPITYNLNFISNKYPLGGMKLDIYEDSLYVYEYRSGFRKEYSRGTWLTDSKKKHLILIGMIPSTDSIPLNLMEKEVTGDSIHIVLNTFDDDAIQWSIVLNEKEYSFTNSTNLIINDVSKVDSLYLKGYKDPHYVAPYLKQIYIRSLTYYPKDKSNYFQISLPAEIDYNIFYYIPLQDTLKRKRTRLIWNRSEWKTTVKLKKETK